MPIMTLVSFEWFKHKLSDHIFHLLYGTPIVYWSSAFFFFFEFKQRHAIHWPHIIMIKQSLIRFTKVNLNHNNLSISFESVTPIERENQTRLILLCMQHADGISVILFLNFFLCVLCVCAHGRLDDTLYEVRRLAF